MLGVFWAMTESDKFLLKWSRAKMPHARIAAKLGLEPGSIQEAIDRLESAQEAQHEVGSDQLAEHFQLTCHQYQLLGEGLRHIGANLNQPVSPAEIQEVIDKTDPGELAVALLKRFMMFQPYTPLDVQKLEEELRFK